MPSQGLIGPRRAMLAYCSCGDSGAVGFALAAMIRRKLMGMSEYSGGGQVP